MGFHVAARDDMRTLMAVLACVTVSALLETSALACPSCPTSRAVAAIVCGTGVWRNLACMVAPFPVMAFVAWRLHHMGDGRRHATTTSED
jgi:hypothetical protein